MTQLTNKAMPIRDIRHISETASHKLFNALMPDHWLVRDVTERDYGIDYYIEIVDEHNRLTGKLVSIQMKSRQSIDWTQKDTFAVSDIKMSSTNYWNDFAIPVFVFLADLDEKEIYYLSVRSYVRLNYLEYAGQNSLTYHFEKAKRIRTAADLQNFQEAYEADVNRPEFENTLFTFLSSLTPYANFIREHYQLDYHMGLEDEDAIYIEAILNNYHFLAKHLKIQNPLPTIHQLKAKNKAMFGDEHYELHEGSVSQIADDLEKMTLNILAAAEKLIDAESKYWLVVNLPLVNFINNYNPEYLFE